MLAVTKLRLLKLSSSTEFSQSSIRPTKHSCETCWSGIVWNGRRFLKRQQPISVYLDAKSNVFFYTYSIFRITEDDVTTLCIDVENIQHHTFNIYLKQYKACNCFMSSCSHKWPTLIRSGHELLSCIQRFAGPDLFVPHQHQIQSQPW